MIMCHTKHTRRRGERERQEGKKEQKSHRLEGTLFMFLWEQKKHAK